MVEEVFMKLGARVCIKVNDRLSVPVTMDIQRDRRGEFFVLWHNPNLTPDITILNVQPKDRHLLLMARAGKEKQKFLCGHDERHWFVAAIPESAPVSSVARAKAALKPTEVLEREERMAIRTKNKDRRRNRAFVRQGEWFFLPQRELHAPERLILKNEPLVRSRMGKPHLAEECYRTGGELVYVSSLAPEGLSEEAYRKYLQGNPGASRYPWRTMQRNPQVYVRGRITHPDHATVLLTVWHRVCMNTETQAKANAAVVFLD
jgi:hypothetical protein